MWYKRNNSWLSHTSNSEQIEMHGYIINNKAIDMLLRKPQAIRTQDSDPKSIVLDECRTKVKFLLNGISENILKKITYLFEGKIHWYQAQFYWYFIHLSCPSCTHCDASYKPAAPDCRLLHSPSMVAQGWLIGFESWLMASKWYVSPLVWLAN